MAGSKKNAPGLFPERNTVSYRALLKKAGSKNIAGQD
jgi:hypothetical protein